MKGNCCFNHIVELAKKDNQEKPIFDYEKLLYESLLIPGFHNLLNHTFKHKHLWAKISSLEGGEGGGGSGSGSGEVWSLLTEGLETMQNHSRDITGNEEKLHSHY